MSISFSRFRRTNLWKQELGFCMVGISTDLIWSRLQIIQVNLMGLSSKRNIVIERDSHKKQALTRSLSLQTALNSSNLKHYQKFQQKDLEPIKSASQTHLPGMELFMELFNRPTLLEKNKKVYNSVSSQKDTDRCFSKRQGSSSSKDFITSLTGGNEKANKVSFVDFSKKIFEIKSENSYSSEKGKSLPLIFRPKQDRHKTSLNQDEISLQFNDRGDENDKINSLFHTIQIPVTDNKKQNQAKQKTMNCPHCGVSLTQTFKQEVLLTVKKLKASTEEMKILNKGLVSLVTESVQKLQQEVEKVANQISIMNKTLLSQVKESFDMYDESTKDHMFQAQDMKKGFIFHRPSIVPLLFDTKTLASSSPRNVSFNFSTHRATSYAVLPQRKPGRIVSQKQASVGTPNTKKFFSKRSSQGPLSRQVTSLSMHIKEIKQMISME